MSSTNNSSNIQKFLLDTPLYTPIKLSFPSEDVNVLYSKSKSKADGHCPYCHKTTTFTIKGHYLSNDMAWSNMANRVSRSDTVKLTCARDDYHVLDFIFMINNLTVQKIGQYPSLADIANDQSKNYKGLLNKQDSSEFHKAIGLAAHGVGIGSFVYLRRIFERIIENRFNDRKDELYFEEEEFRAKRMSEKIEALHEHLPAYLTSNSRIYSIMSPAIHELSEETCLSFFPIIRQSIIFILEEDKKIAEERREREDFAKSIRDFEAWEAKQIKDGNL
ncbi:MULTISPECIES: hypothetical protein [unclassified Methylobacterium]|uniref:hypothetical protein n=1 Tax=unclassified Methylobacterium TaxID=2615210 RepID=UPI00226AD95D|nr:MULTISPECIES: hypothetical protein [unclassified Methylobacterium]